MNHIRHVAMTMLLGLGLVASGPAGAEVVDEIVAWVDGDIITLSEFEEEQKMREAEAHRQFSGEELDRELERARKELLISIIDRKILLHHAKAMGYDMDKMADAYVKAFMQKESISSPEELRELAESSGMTVAKVREQLIELYAPQDLIDMEVINRISVSDGEIEGYYAENQALFAVKGEVTLREIVLLADDANGLDARRDEAQQVWQRVSSGEDFGTVAREVSESGTADNGGKFGPLAVGDLAEILSVPAFSLPAGGLSELMETPYGFHVIKVESRIEDHVRSLDDVRSQIRSVLENRKFKTELEVFMQKARAESEWCVKPKHKDLLSVEAPPPCERL